MCLGCLAPECPGWLGWQPTALHPARWNLRWLLEFFALYGPAWQHWDRRRNSQGGQSCCSGCQASTWTSPVSCRPRVQPRLGPPIFKNPKTIQNLCRIGCRIWKAAGTTLCYFFQIYVYYIEYIRMIFWGKVKQAWSSTFRQAAIVSSQLTFSKSHPEYISLVVCS